MYHLIPDRGVDVQLNNLKEVEAELQKYIPIVKEITGKDITLKRMRPLMTRLGNPQNLLNIIHIAGTSGKTSTSYYIASLFSQAGKKVGLTISPHVDSVAERVQIDLEPLNEQSLTRAFGEFMKIIEGVDPEPTYFELLIAFVYWYFAEASVDYAVIETGLGGLHDATNVADGSDKICVITDIGYDHMHVLGNTLDKIAAQKAGIIYPNNEVICYHQSDEVHKVITKTVEDKEAHLHIANLVNDMAARDLPLFQQRNWQLARDTYDLVAQRDNLPKLSEEQLIQSTKVIVPARMEIIDHGKQMIILDGSHNAQKLEALIDSLLAKYPGKSIAVLTSFVSTKKEHLVENIEQLKRLGAPLIITSFHGSQDRPNESMDPEIVQAEAEKQGIKTSVIISPEAALSKLLESSQDILLVTGSFYLLNHIRPLIIKR